MAGLALSTGLSWKTCALLWAIPPPLLALMFLAKARRARRGKVGARNFIGFKTPLGLYAALLAAYVCMTSGTGLIAMMPLYISGFFGLSAAAAAFIVGYSRAAGVAGQLLGGYLSDRLGRVKVLASTASITAASTLILATAPYGPAFVSSLFVFAASQTAFYPVFYAFIADVSEEEVRRSVEPVLAPGLALGSGATPFIVGSLAEAYGYPTALLYPLALSLISVPAVILAWLATSSLSKRHGSTGRETWLPAQASKWCS